MGVSHITLRGSALKRRKVIPVVMPHGEGVGVHKGVPRVLVVGEVHYHSTSPSTKGIPIGAVAVGVGATGGICTTTGALRVSRVTLCVGQSSGVRTLGEGNA